MDELKYPVGRFSPPPSVSADQRRSWIEEIAQTPAKMRKAVAGLSEEQMNTPYRPGGWTVRQVVHHVPESHMNSYIRFKLALTEDRPTIKPYDEDAWGKLADASAPAEPSLALLDALHSRWVTLLQSMTPEQWGRSFVHPELGSRTLDQTLGLYDWHCRHHVAHITRLRDRMGW